MEEKFQYQIQLNSLKTIPYAILENFITQMHIQKPHLQISIDSLQFVKSKRKDLEYQDQGKIEDGFDRFDDSYGTMYLMCLNLNIISQIDEIKWVYIQAFDTQSSLHKTLKVQFLELFGNKLLQYQKELMFQKSKITSLNQDRKTFRLGDRSLILNIYDYYFLSISGEDLPLYFVVEQEYVHSAYQKHSKNITNTENDIIQHKQRCLEFFQKCMGFNISLNLLSPLANYYLAYNNDNTIRMKLSPIDFYPLFFKLYSDFEMSLIEERNKQTLNFINQSKMTINNQSESLEAIKIDISSYFQNEPLNIHFKRNFPRVFEFHDIQLLEILTQHPWFKNVELEVYNKSVIQFSKLISGRQFFLTCVKYENHYEAEIIYKLFEQLCSIDFFHPESCCDIIPFIKSNTYLLFIELNFATCKNSLQVDQIPVEKEYMVKEEITNKLDKLFQLQIKQPILFEYYYGELINATPHYFFQGMDTLFCYFKEIFTFQHIYSIKGNLQIGQYQSRGTFEDRFFENKAEYMKNFSKHQETCLEKNINSNEIKVITDDSFSQKRKQQISDIIELDYSYNSFCYLDYISKRITLHSQIEQLKYQQLQQLLIDYEILIDCDENQLNTILQTLNKPTQVKIINLKISIICLQQYQQNYQKFCHIFPKLVELHITIDAQQVCQIIDLFQIQNLLFLEKLNFNLTLSPTHCQLISQHEWHLIDNFFEVFKIKKLKNLKIDFKKLDGYLFHQSYFQFIDQINQEPYSKTIMSDNNKIDQSYYNLISLLNYQHYEILINEIKRIKDQIPHITFEIIYSEVDSGILASINIIQQYHNQMSILLTLHLLNNISNNKNKTHQREDMISYESKYDQRLSSRCSRVEYTTYNLYEIVLECVLYEIYNNKMKLWFDYEVKSNCEHCDFNQLLIQFYLKQVNLQELNIDLKYCSQTIELMNSNNNYLGLKSSKFNQLFCININFELDHMTLEAIQGLNENIKVCKKAHKIKISCSEQNQNQHIRYLKQFLKIPHLVQFEFTNSIDANQNFVY